MNDADKIKLMDQIIASATSAASDKLTCAEAVLERIAQEPNHAFSVQLAAAYFKNPSVAAKQAERGWAPVTEARSEPIPAQVDGDYIIQFGKKHKGMRLDDLVRVAQDYCVWLLDEAEFFNYEKYRPIRRYLEQALRRDQKQYLDEDPKMQEIPF